MYGKRLTASPGSVTDESTAKFLRHYLTEFHAFIVRVYSVLPRNVQEELGA